MSFLYLFCFFYKLFCSKIVLLNSPTSFTCLPVTHDFRLRVKESNCAVHNFLLKKSMRQLSTNGIKLCIKNLKNQSSPLKHQIIEWFLSTDRRGELHILFREFHFHPRFCLLLYGWTKCLLLYTNYCMMKWCFTSSLTRPKLRCLPWFPACHLNRLLEGQQFGGSPFG